MVSRRSDLLTIFFKEDVSMITIKNLEELNRLIDSGKLAPFYISAEAEQAVKEALYDNMTILVDNYGDGSGGYFCIFLNDFCSAQDEYLSELGKYNLSPDDYEYDTILSSDGKTEIHIQLFVMTEYHLLILYRKSICAEEAV